MQKNILIQNSSNLSTQTDTSTKQQFHLQKFMPFLILQPRGNSSTTHKAPPKINWSNQEKQQFSIFACYFKRILKDFSKQKSKWDIFKGMSMFIKTKNPHQCRSYYLKLLREFKEISIFLRHSVRRIHRMSYKMIKAQNQLYEIQNKLNLNLDQNFQRMDETQFNKQISFIKLSLDIFSNQPLIHKLDKPNLVKTSDCYDVQQNQTRKNDQDFNRLLTFLLTPNRSNIIRQYLPSFDCDDRIDDPNKKQIEFSLLSQNSHATKPSKIELIQNQSLLMQNQI